MLIKKDFKVWKHHYRCPHEGCSKILARQYWPLHVEMDHINGQKMFSKDKNLEFKCFECEQVFNSRIKRGQHRTCYHSIVKQKMEDGRKKRAAKELLKIEMGKVNNQRM